MTGPDTKYTGLIAAQSAKGLLTGTATRVLGDTTMLVKSLYYDCHGNVIQSHESNAVGGYEHDYYHLTFTGKPLAVRHEHSTSSIHHVDINTMTYDAMERLLTTTVTYDGKGNITALDGAGGFGYASSRPYALSQISLSGSAFPTAEQHITFNAMNRPDTIIEGTVTARFKYFEDGSRSAMTVAGNDRNNQYHYYGDQLTTITINQLGCEGEKQILFVGGDAYTAPAALVRERENGASDWSQQLYNIERDNLGSITHVVDSTGLVVQELSYDVWGRLRDPVTQQPYAPGESPSLLLGRGYCGHEHLPEFNLLNMNARLYDPWTARFLSPDPYVQLPDFTQSFNRYSYCWNNPLKLVDLSGKIIDDSFMTPLQRIHYWHDIWELRKNKLFNTFYDRIQKSSQIIYVMYGRTHSSEDNSPSEAYFDYRNNTICLGMSYDKWDLTEELYHAYQHINNTLIDGHNAEYEVNVVRLLSISPIATTFESLTEMRLNIALGIYGTDETGSFTIENEKMFVTDYINSGKLFINEPGRDPHYHIPVISCPPLLLELLRTVFR